MRKIEKESTEMSKFDHQVVNEYLENLGAKLGASEFHGLVTGYLSANNSATAAKRLSLFSEWLNIIIDTQSAEVAQVLYTDTLDSLHEYSDFDFRILLPDDDEAITERSKALSAWCTGYLSGFGSAGRFEQADLSKDVVEAFTDLSNIAGLSDDVPEGEENEADLMEISEFVRISVLVIYTECGDKKVSH